MTRAKHLFQLNLDVSGRACLVVGGDDEALEKTERLLECEAVLTLVSPKVLPEIDTMARDGRIRRIVRRYEPGDEAGKYFVLNCVKTEPEMSETLFRRCVDAGILISSYDQPEVSTATMSALVRAGSIRIAISSNGASPSVARILRIEFEKMLDERFSRFVDWVASYRERLVNHGVTPSERKKILRELLAGFEIKATCRYPDRFDKNLPPD